MTLSSQENVISADSEGYRKANIVTEVQLPRELNAKVLIWSDLTIDNLSEMDSKWDSKSSEVKEYLAKCFDLNHYKEKKQEAVLLDLYFYSLQFSRDCKFNMEQTSAVFSIIKNIHEAAIETPFNNLPQCYKYMKDLILCHSVKRPPFGIELFSPEEAKLVSEYIVNTYFRHFKLYKFVFTPKLQLDISFNYKGFYDVGGEALAEDAESKPATAATGFTDAVEIEDEPEEEETVAMKELKLIIEEELGKHLDELKSNFEQNIKANDELMNTKLQSMEETSTTVGSTNPKRPNSKAAAKKK